MIRRNSVILSLVMLFLVGFIPTKGALRFDGAAVDSLPIRRAVTLTTDGQKQAAIYRNFASADSLYRRAIVEDSTYAPAYYAMAQLFSQRRAPIDSTVRYAGAAYRLDSLNKWYNETYAQSLAMSGKFVEARRLYKRAIESAPQQLSAYIMVAMLYRQTGEPYEALAVLDSAQMRAGKSSYLTSMRQELLIATGQREKALEEVIEIVEIDPQNVDNRVMLAELYISTKQDSLAQKEYEAAVAIDSTSPMLLNTVAQFYADRGNLPAFFSTTKRLFRSPEESLENKIATFTRITTDRSFYSRNFYAINELAMQLYVMYPSTKSVVELYAQHLIASGSLDQALEVYKKHAAEDLPAEYDYYTSIIDIESYRQRPDSVELYSARAIELFPDRHELRLSQANFYSYTKRYDEAIASYKDVLKVIESDSLRSRVWGSVGDIYHQKSLGEKPGGRKAKSLMRQAYKSYDKALDYDRANPLVLNNYAYFLSLERRDLERALDMAGRATALAEGNSTYLDTYAWILYELERYDEAKKIMRQVIALDTTQSAEIQFHYGEILAALGEDFMAEIYYDKALKLGYNAVIIENRKARLKD